MTGPARHAQTDATTSHCNINAQLSYVETLLELQMSHMCTSIGAKTQDRVPLFRHGTHLLHSPSYSSGRHWILYDVPHNVQVVSVLVQDAILHSRPTASFNHEMYFTEREWIVEIASGAVEQPASERCSPHVVFPTAGKEQQ